METKLFFMARMSEQLEAEYMPELDAKKPDGYVYPVLKLDELSFRDRLRRIYKKRGPQDVVPGSDPQMEQLRQAIKDSKAAAQEVNFKDVVDD